MGIFGITTTVYKRYCNIQVLLELFEDKHIFEKPEE